MHTSNVYLAINNKIQPNVMRKIVKGHDVIRKIKNFEIMKNYRYDNLFFILNYERFEDICRKFPTITGKIMH